jgi:predicted dehydrogenase
MREAMPKSTPRDASGHALRWGFVGTGAIATAMARVLRTTSSGELAAVASRTLERANAFAAEHGAGRGFHSWEEMMAWDGIDAVYIATPTALREAIGVAAARAGRHVLAEKPFASLSSLRRLVGACRETPVAFMDATHFVHHPRTAAVRKAIDGTLGRPSEIDSRFLIGLAGRDDIRYDPALEPLGALGDLGWYCMRATLEYLSPRCEPRSVEASLRRDAGTGAVVSGEGLLTFADDTVSRWRCAFDAETVDIGLTLSGARGAIRMDDFVGERRDGSGAYVIDPAGEAEQALVVASDRSAPALMFETFSRIAREPALREPWIVASERTQALLDATWAAAVR